MKFGFALMVVCILCAFAALCRVDAEVCGIEKRDTRIIFEETLCSYQPLAGSRYAYVMTTNGLGVYDVKNTVLYQNGTLEQASSQTVVSYTNWTTIYPEFQAFPSVYVFGTAACSGNETHFFGLLRLILKRTPPLVSRWRLW